MSLVNLYLGFATAVYLRCGRQAGTFQEFAWFLVHREAFAALARVRPDAPFAAPSAPPVEVAPAATAAPPPEEEEVNEADYEFYRHRSAERELNAEEPEGEEHPVAFVFQRTTAELRDMIGELSQLDRRLREAAAAPHGEVLQACAVALNETVHRRLDLLRQCFGPLSRHDGESPQFMVRRAALEVLADTLSGELNATLTELVGLNFASDDPSAAAQPLVTAQEKINGVCHVYRDLLLDALLAIVRDELGCENLDLHLRNDEQTGLAARAGLETAVADLRAQGPGESSVVLVDVDLLGAVNKDHGALLGDAVIEAVAGFVSSARRRDWLAVRVAGQQFLLLCTRTRLHEAAEAAERIRQTIEGTTFRRQNATLRVTVSAAVVLLLPDESVDELLERASATVREAKSYGRNRTFLYERECPAPVVPLDLTIVPQELAL
jgi:diguanylate cyclase (GGDEF)-like protein